MTQGLLNGGARLRVLPGCVQREQRRLVEFSGVLLQALEFAVNKEVISRIATSGTSPVAWGPLKPTNWSYNKEVEALYTNGPAAGGGAFKSARDVVAVASVLLPRELAKPQIQFVGRE